MKLFSEKRWGWLSGVFITLLLLAYIGNNVAAAYAPAINNAFGIVTSKVTGGSGDEYVYYQSDYANAEDLKAYLTETGILVETEGLVLLRNDNGLLPLDKGAKITPFFTASVNFNYSSSGSSAAETSGYPTLREALEKSGFAVNETLWNAYKTGEASQDNGYGRATTGNTYQIKEAGWDVFSEATVAAIDGVALVTIARDSGEGKDINLTTSKKLAKGSGGQDGSYLSLSDQEVDVLQHLTQLKSEGKIEGIVVLLNGSTTVQLDFLFRDDIDVDAALWIGNVGSSGIYGVAQVLCGDAPPSGKLSDTWLKNNFSSPAMASWSLNSSKKFTQKYTNAEDLGLNSTQENYAVYVEGIYVGYRYYETRYEDMVMGSDGVGAYSYDADVAYPFGFGLSYTDFAWSDFKVTENEKDFTVQVTVTNTGSTAGKDVVEIYLQKPYTDYDREHKVEKAAVELAGFAKTSLLAAGASETVTVTVEKERFKSYDADGYKTYILDAGDYYLTAADNAHAAANNVLTAKGYTAETTDGRMDENGDAALTFKWTNGTLDATTYAVSSQTGYAITNQLDHADVNRYEGSGENQVTYVSRSDWEGTWPTEAVTLSIATDQMKADIDSNKALPAGGDTPTYGADNGMTLAMLRGLSYDDPQWEKLLDQMSYADQALLVSTGQFATVPLESISKPATSENDGPTGVANTTTGSSFPSEGIWASTWNTELIQRMGDAIAEDALASGQTGMYAGGVNIHRTPFDGRSHEYFSEDAVLTAVAIQYEVKGLQNKGVVAHVKHLAFNEEETNRNGACIWLNEQEARELMLLPFEYALSESKGDSGAVMTSFNRAGVIWTGADSGLLNEIVINEWGFHGYNITDMAESNGKFYMTYQDGIVGGTDLYLGSGDALTDFKDNAAFAQRLREASHHILYSIVTCRATCHGGVMVSTSLSTPRPFMAALLFTMV